MAENPRRSYDIDRLFGFVFMGGCALMALAVFYAAVTKKMNVAFPVFVGTGWLVFLAMNVVVFIKGEFKVKQGPLVSRRRNPLLFHLIAVPFALASMAIPTAMLLGFFFWDKK